MNKPRLIFSHLCDHVTVSREGKLSVIGIFKEVTGKSIPATHPLMILVFEINLGDTGEHNIKIEFKDPDKDNVKEPINLPNIKVGSADVNYGQVLNITDTKFRKKGCYKIIIKVDDEKVGEEKLFFKLKENE